MQELTGQLAAAGAELDNDGSVACPQYRQ